MGIINDRKELKRLVESYGKADVMKYVQHVNEDDTHINEAKSTKILNYMNELRQIIFNTFKCVSTHDEFNKYGREIWNKASNLKFPGILSVDDINVFYNKKEAELCFSITGKTLDNLLNKDSMGPDNRGRIIDYIYFLNNALNDNPWWFYPISLNVFAITDEYLRTHLDENAYNDITSILKISKERRLQQFTDRKRAERTIGGGLTMNQAYSKDDLNNLKNTKWLGNKLGDKDYYQRKLNDVKRRKATID